MGRQRIVVAEDEPDIRRLYRLWLADTYDVTAVSDGESALEDGQDRTDVYILDRNLPKRRGEDVARELVSRGYDGTIAMVTAREPDPTIAMLPLDEYVTKPIEKSELTALVERLLTRLEAPNDVRDLFAMVTRKYRLETALAPSTLDGSMAYHKLRSRIESQYAQSLDSDVSSERIAGLAKQTLPETVDFEQVGEDLQSRPSPVEASVGAGQEL